MSNPVSSFTSRSKEFSEQNPSSFGWSGCPEVAPGPPSPQDGILLLYYSPVFHFLFPIVLMHFAQAKTLFPEDSFTHCKLGSCLLLAVGLYLLLSFTLRQTRLYFLAQKKHCFFIKLIIYYLYIYLFFYFNKVFIFFQAIV